MKLIKRKESLLAASSSVRTSPSLYSSASFIFNVLFKLKKKKEEEKEFIFKKLTYVSSSSFSTVMPSHSISLAFPKILPSIQFNDCQEIREPAKATVTATVIPSNSSRQHFLCYVQCVVVMVSLWYVLVQCRLYRAQFGRK